MRRPAAALAAALALLALAACGRDAGAPDDDERRPTIGVGGDARESAVELGFPGFATKNTTRIGGADPDADAAAAARAVYPSLDAATRPPAVALLDARDWRVAVAGSVLAAPPLRAALLLSDRRRLSPTALHTLQALAPTGAEELGDAQVVRVGDVARPARMRSLDVGGRDVFALARALDAFHANATGRPGSRVLVVSADDPAYAMPAASWAAKSGDPILFTRRDSLPPDTRAALERRSSPRIYVLGPASAVSDAVFDELDELGTARRIAGPDPVASAVAFARYRDASFGWGVTDPGHGLVFARSDRPLDAAAAAMLASHGSYGPLLLLDDPAQLPSAVGDYLLDIQPGYTSDPVRGVYNHGWLLGDDRAIAISAQARIDSLLEIRQVEDPSS